MVINHLLDVDLGNLRPIDTPVAEGGRRVVGYLEDQPVRAPEIDGELSLPVGVEQMTASRDAVHIRESWGSVEGRQTPLEELPVVGSPLLAALAVIRARLLQLAAGPRDLDGGLLDVLTLGVNV
jgi:hypothetical protein